MSRSKKPSQLKVIAGTDRPDRPDPELVDLPLVGAVPDPPDWLPNAHAVKEWKKLAGVLHATGLLTEAGLGPLAVLCSLFGKIVQLNAAGETPTGHMIAQYRSLANDFGLTPVAQGKVKGGGKEVPDGNPFAKHAKR